MSGQPDRAAARNEEEAGPDAPEPVQDARLLAAAARVLEDAGWQGLTVEAVAEAAGLSRVTAWRLGASREGPVAALPRARAGGCAGPAAGGWARPRRGPAPRGSGGPGPPPPFPGAPPPPPPCSPPPTSSPPGPTRRRTTSTSRPPACSPTARPTGPSRR